MAKFTLPINSIVRKGKTFSDINKSENMPVSYTHLTLTTILLV